VDHVEPSGGQELRQGQEEEEAGQYRGMQIDRLNQAPVEDTHPCVDQKATMAMIIE
jgi:hypothetical protein